MQEIVTTVPGGEHVITFGQVSDRALPMRLIHDDQERRELKEGTGRYAQLRQPAVLRQDELYAYLRLGIPSNSALTLKALGYPTAEAVSADPQAAALLPDTLVMEDRPYPVDFIDTCEQTGVPAPACEQALRRGLTTSNIDGTLSPMELVTLFARVLRRPIAVVGAHAMAMEAICTGEVPLAAAVWENGHAVSLEQLAAVLRVLREPGYATLFAHLRSRPNVFARLVGSLPRGKVNPERVRVLNAVLEACGDEALELQRPEVCLAPGADMGCAGLAAAEYVERVMGARSGARDYDWSLDPDSGAILVDFGWRRWAWREGEEREQGNPTVADLDRLRRAGAAPDVVAGWVFDEDRSASTLLTALNEGMSTALIDGAL